MPDLTTRAVVSSYITTGGASPVVAIPAEARVGDVVGIVLTTNDSARLMTGAPTGWTLAYNTAFGTASRMLLWKVYASSDGTSVALPFSAQPAMQCTVFVLDGTVHSGLGAAGAVTTRGASATTITAAAAGSADGANLVIAHEKASSHPSIALVSPATTTLANVTNGGASTAAQYVGSYDTSGGTAARTITYGTASANGAGLQIPVVMVAATAPTGTATGSWSTEGAAAGTTPAVGESAGTAAGGWAWTGAAAGTAPTALVTTLAQCSNTVAGQLRGGWWLTGVAGGATIRMVASTSSSFTAPIYSSTLTAAASGGITGVVTGLDPDTVYHLGVDVDGVIQASGRATIRTIQPARVLGTSTWATGSCNYTGSNHVVFDQIRTSAPRGFVHQGDRHYADTSVAATWRAAMKSSMTAARQAALAAVVPITWDPDNHDWGGNRSWRDSPIKDVAPAAMRETTGDYAHATGFYRTWVDHDVQHVEIDRWSFRDKDIDGTSSDGDTSSAKTNSDATKVMLGTTQEAWLLNLLATSSARWIVVYTGFPLTDTRFAAYQAETARIAAAIAGLPAAQRAKIIGVGGDSHDIRANSGTSKSVWGIPTLNASGLDQSGAAFDTTGWDIGIISPVEVGRGYYSRLTVTDTAEASTFKWDAVRDDGTILMTWSRIQATTVAEGTATGALTYAGAAAGTSTRTGSATGALAYAGAATGASSRTGAATGTATFTGAATGASSRQGAATGTHTWAGTAAGTAPVVGGASGAASGALAFTGTAAGQSTRAGTAAGTITYVTAAAGTTARAGTAAGTLVWSTSAAGTAPALGVASGTATGSVTYASAAAGAAPALPTRTGTAAGTSTWTGAATGTDADLPVGRDITVTARLRHRPWAATTRPRTWTARTIMATDLIPTGSKDTVTLDVTANVVLDTQAVEISLTNNAVRDWQPARWIGEPATTRAAETLDTVTFDAPPHTSYTVHVRVYDNPEEPIIEAEGRIHVVP